MRRLAAVAGIGVRARRWLGIRLGRLSQYPPRPQSIESLVRPGSNHDLPTVVVVTPSYNQARFIGRTIESVLAQGYAGLTYVIQDAMSRDGTEQILTSHRGGAIDIRREADRGQADALNRGFSGTKSEIMAYLNSDDLFLPGTLHLVGRYFRDHPEVDVIYGNRLVIDEADREVGRWILPGHDDGVLRFVDYVPQETLFWRRRIWDRTGAHFEDGLHFAMDWELILRFQDAGALIRHVPELFGLFRAHGDQKSQALYRKRGAREMADLRVSYRAPGMRQRAALHWRYLQRHRGADAAFAASLRSP